MLRGAAIWAIVLVSPACSEGGGRGRPGAGDASAAGTEGGVNTGGRGGALPVEGGTGGSGGATPEPVGEVTACRTYLRAACERFAQCLGPSSYTGCMRLLDDCPDYFFSDGSNRTVEELMGCAQEWPTYSCGVIQSSAGASTCPVPGERAAGEPCAFSSQCASQRCSSLSPSCGTCQQTVEVGDLCDDVTLLCPLGVACIGGTCTVPPPGEPFAPDAGPLPDLCTGDAGSCSLLREENESCGGATDECIPGTECTAGACAATGHQGLFDAACGPLVRDD